MDQAVWEQIRELEAQRKTLQDKLAGLYQEVGQANRPPLAGVRIVDLSWAVFGPLSTQMLADMGAEVIKVERVDGGDVGRVTHSAYFTNRNKQSLALNLREPKGREVMLKLAETADILVHSFRPGVVERLGIDYATISQRNPRIVYCSLSGFGPDGPYESRPATDLIIQGMSGMINLMGHADGPPTSVGFLACDIAGAFHNTIAMLLGFVVQQQRGVGQHIELSLLDSAIALQSFPITWYLNHPDEPPERAGKGHWRQIPLYGVYDTKDRPITLMAGMRATNWPLLITIPGLESLASDPRFATRDSRMEHGAELDAALENLLREDTQEEWVKRFLAVDLVCGPVYSYDDLFADPQFQHNDMVGELGDGEGEAMKILKPPIRLHKTPGQIRSPMPSLGQHTHAILTGLGYPDDVIEAFREEGIVAEE